ncbi:hypothetical protein AOLI_G00204060 [Acnodon oligacanthus]
MTPRSSPEPGCLHGPDPPKGIIAAWSVYAVNLVSPCQPASESPDLPVVPIEDVAAGPPATEDTSVLQPTAEDDSAVQPRARVPSWSRPTQGHHCSLVCVRCQLGVSLPAGF